MAKAAPEIEIQHNARVGLRSMPSEDRQRVLRAVEQVATYGVDTAGDSVKLVDPAGRLYVCRVGDLRVAFRMAPDTNTVIVTGIFEQGFLDHVSQQRAAAQAG
jgi:mRNA-degrading endonuclease RelE of RelBE toxin-antitoxin system